MVLLMFKYKDFTHKQTTILLILSELVPDIVRGPLDVWYIYKPKLNKPDLAVSNKGG